MRFVLAGGALLALFSSCKREQASWDTGIVTPLAHASLSIDNLLTDSLISTNSDGSIRLVYSTDFLGLKTDTMFDMPDTTIAQPPFVVPISTTLNPGDQLLNNFPNYTTFALGNVQLVYGILSAGKMYITIRNDVQARLIVHYQLPLAQLNGIPFDTTFTVNAAPDGTHGYIMSLAFDLSGYGIDMTGASHNQVNTLAMTYSAMVDPTESPVAVTPQDSLVFTNTFSGMRPYYVRGYFGSQNIQIGPETTGFSVFNHVRSGSLGLDSLTMSLSVKNYLGMDARMKINNIWSTNSHTGQTVYLNNSVIGSTINVNRATLTNSWPPSNPSEYDFLFNNANSNAKNLVEIMPDQLGYDVSLITNPLGNVSGNNDFFFANYDIDAKLDVEMPLNFFASQLVMEDTMTVDFTSVKNKENILQGTLTLHAQNSFPFSAAIQLYLLDANGQVTDSIVALPNTIAAGTTTNSSSYIISTGFVSSTLNIPLNPTQTQALLNSSKILMKADFDTNSSPSYVKIYSTNRLDAQLTADFDYRMGN